MVQPGVAQPPVVDGHQQVGVPRPRPPPRLCPEVCIELPEPALGNVKGRLADLPAHATGYAL